MQEVFIPYHKSVFILLYSVFICILSELIFFYHFAASALFFFWSFCSGVASELLCFSETKIRPGPGFICLWGFLQAAFTDMKFLCIFDIYICFFGGGQLGFTYLMSLATVRVKSLAVLPIAVLIMRCMKLQDFSRTDGTESLLNKSFGLRSWFCFWPLQNLNSCTTSCLSHYQIRRPSFNFLGDVLRCSFNKAT